VEHGVGLEYLCWAFLQLSEFGWNDVTLLSWLGPINIVIGEEGSAEKLFVFGFKVAIMNEIC
jgi:hypothetical protein